MDLPRRLVAEALGTALLVAAVVGSGIMAERLTGDGALTLLCNTLPTGAMLVVLITILGPISGAHLNPAVTTVFAIRRAIFPRDAALYIVVQIAGGIAGTAAAHVMFGEPVLQISSTTRTGTSLWLAEAIAVFGLVSVILAAVRLNGHAVPWMVGLYITSAYWFTASTSFTNPAVTIARSLTDSFSVIRPVDAPGFIASQFAGAIIAAMLMGWLLRPTEQTSPQGGSTSYL
ncbi:MAG: MIP/aquaporin family protein [Rhizobiaceae bacterium]